MRVEWKEETRFRYSRVSCHGCWSRDTPQTTVFLGSKPFISKFLQYNDIKVLCNVVPFDVRPQTSFRRCLAWCRHFEMISERLFKSSGPSCSRISNFSWRQSWHRFDEGLKGGCWLMIFHFIWCCPPRSLILHTSFESSVAFLYFTSRKSFSWFPNLVLNAL